MPQPVVITAAVAEADSLAVDGKGRHQQAGQLVRVKRPAFGGSRNAAAVGLQDLRRRTAAAPAPVDEPPLTIRHRQSEGTLLSKCAQIHFIGQRPVDANDRITGLLPIFGVQERLHGSVNGREDGGLKSSELPEVTAENLLAVDHWNPACITHVELMRRRGSGVVPESVRSGMRRRVGLMPVAINQMFIDWDVSLIIIFMNVT